MAFRDNHIVSACYLAQWAGDDGRLQVVKPPNPESIAKRPARTGFRPNFWGRDPRVRRSIEDQLSRIEDPAAKALRGLPGSWPLEPGTDDWFSLLALIAVHMRRNPFAQQHMHRIEREVVARNLPAYERDWPGDHVEDFLARVSTDGFRAQSLLDHLNLPTSVLGLDARRAARVRRRPSRHE